MEKRKEKLKGYLTISELSKLCHTSTDTLRYYDKIGLFKPEYVNPETNYRYYSYEQSEQISTILKLRSQDISTSDILEYMETRNLDNSVELLEKLRETLQEKIAEMAEMQSAVDLKLESIANSTQHYEEWSVPQIRQLGERKILSRGEYIEKFRDSIYQQMKLENLYQQSITSDNAGTIILPESLYDDSKKRLSRSPIILLKEADEAKLSPQALKYVRTIKPGRYLCITGRGRFRYACDTAMTIRQYIYEHEYVVVGDIIERDIIDINLTNDINEVIYMIEVPVVYKWEKDNEG